MKQRKYISARLGGALSLIASGLLAISANADPLAAGTVIGVDFGQTAPNNGAGNIFNAATSGTSGSIAAGSVVDMDNAVIDGVSVTWAGAQYNGLGAADSADLPGQPAIYNDSNLTDFLLNKQGNTITLTFAGLDDSLTYNLNIGGGFTQGGDDGNTLYQADGQSFTSQHDDGALAWGNLDGLSTDGSGVLVITVDDQIGKSNDFAMVAALTLTAVSVTGPVAVQLAVVEYNATNGTLNLTATDITEGQTFHLEQSDDLVGGDFTTLLPVFDFDSTTAQPFEIPVDPSTTSALFFKTFMGDSLEVQPNLIIIFTDDQGYEDLGCFGSPNILTPNIDRMAKEGMRFTSFYGQTVCGPSRAALMTGCLPLRVAKKNNSTSIHPPLHTQEITIAEVLKEAGYATACFGKWDLAGHTQGGYSAELMPRKQGFDYYFGTPSSNDKYVNIIRNEELIEEYADLDLLTMRYTEEATKFIRENHQNPFFVYIPHSMPHVLLGASDDFRGTSERGLYGDVIAELDWSVGRILDTVKELGLDENTYIIFTSDNGPWWSKGQNGGTAFPLRGAKTSTWEGGLRVPCVMRAPGKIPADTVCDGVASTMDMLPTLARLAGAQIPSDRVIDGHDITDLMHGKKGAQSPTTAFYYYQHTHLQAVRSGKWKLFLPSPAEDPYPSWSGHIQSNDIILIENPMLFDLENDIGETTDVAEANPEVVANLLELAEWARNDIGDYNRIGENARFSD